MPAITPTIARVCHEAVRALQIAAGEPNPSPAWDDAEQWMHDSTIETVQAALGGQTPEQAHEEWLRQRRRDGWTYGPVKDVEAKTNPALVAYEDLSEAQKDKDRVVVAIVEALSGRAS